MNTRIQRWCAWSAIPFLIVYFIGAAISGFLPPMSPMVPAPDVANFFIQHRASVETGQLIALTAATFMFFWPAAIAAQIARIEGGNFPILALVHYASSITLCFLFMLCSLIWIIAGYRTDLDANTIRLLNDSGWLIFVVAYPEYGAMMLSLGIAGLLDRRAQPFLPRWAAWVTLSEVVIGTGGIFAGFVTDGPFAWNGLIGFYIPLSTFLIWLLAVLLPHLLRAIARQEAGIP